MLILDEPANGLDPPGMRWMRDLLRAEAGRGRAVLVSSHLLSEVAQSVDDVVVIAAGRRRAAGSLASVLGSSNGPATRVRSDEPERIATALRECGLGFEPAEGGGLLVRSAPDRVGSVAAEHGIPLNELSVVSRSLEDAFFELTEGAR